MVGGFTGGSDDLLVALVADQQDVVVVAGEPLGFVVHLGDQRAGGVDDLQLPLGGRDVHRRRDAVRGEHHDRALGNLVGLFDEHRARLGQGLHHVAVVHDLMPDVDGCAVFFQRTLDCLDGAVHAGAVSAWLGQQHTLAGYRLGDRAHRAGCARPDPNVRAHVHGWRHGNQVTVCRHGLASSRGSAWR
jgi:hypothetical protein